MLSVLNYIESEKERYLSELITFLKIPSISGLQEHNKDTRKAAEWLIENLKQSGLVNARMIETKGHPIVYAEWMEKKDAPTVLIYGHYDVQPVDPLELWNSKPFDPVIKNGKIWGRGTSDDKGQVFTHIKSIEAFLKNHKSLPVNVKFVIEGEEEAGSSHLEGFIRDNKEMLAADAVLISDTEWFADGLPSICYALRGIAFIEVKVTGPNRDLHSGTFGGAVDNPINVLCNMVSKLKTNAGVINIPGFYDDVVDLTQEERDGFKELPFSDKKYMEDLGVNALYGEIGYTTLERTWARPSLDLNGIKGGFQGEGAKTVLPSHASAKISMRLVPNQKADDISYKIARYLKQIAPRTVKVEVQLLHGGNPVIAPREHPAVKAGMEALEKAFGTKPVFMREGGSIPITEIFSSVLGAPSVLMGLGLPGDNIHSPNENFDINNFYGGIKASAIFLDKFSKR
jgi:acetylornithine deacetylase/succinyl-diaminopimelate desuccinylase-like protein